MRLVCTILCFSLGILSGGLGQTAEEYTTPSSFNQYHSNLGRQSIVKANRQEEFNWVGQEPGEIRPGSIPLGSLREWSKRRKLADAEKSSKDAVLQGTNQKKDQEILQGRKIKGWVGLLPGEVLPGSVPLGSLKNRKYKVLAPAGSQSHLEGGGEKEASEFPLQLGLMGGIRPYYTSNVLRLNQDELGSGVLETSAGFSVSVKPQKVGRYLSLVPRLDFLMQWANYEESKVRDLLNYRFGMVKAGLDFRFPQEWTLSLGLEYDFLHNQATGDQMFDAIVPSVGVQKILSLGSSTFLFLHGGVRYSLTEKNIAFPVEGVFADDGDNIQTTLGLNLIQTFFDRNQLVLSPSIGISHTHYLRNLHDGRNDLVFFAGVNGTWQFSDFFALQLFLNYSAMSTNSVGDSLLGPSSSFYAVDVGASMNLNYFF